MEILDLRKEWKSLYSSSEKEVGFLDVPAMQFLMVDGAGDPNLSPEFQQAVTALYALSYALKFQTKRGARAIDYGVMPLEGLWWAENAEDFVRLRRDAWKWRVMIAQPEFLGAAELEVAREELRRKKKDAGTEKVRLERFTEGPSAQILYKGPYSGEGPTIARMQSAIHAAGHELHGKHHEIYLNDARRTAPERRKTILRQPYC